MAELTVDKLREMLAEALGGSANSAPRQQSGSTTTVGTTPPAASGSSGNNSIMDLAIGKIQGLGIVSGNTGTNIGGLGEAAMKAAGVYTTFGAKLGQESQQVVEKLGRVIPGMGQVGGFAIDQMAQTRQQGSYGLGNQGLIDFSARLRSAGMGLNDYVGIVNTSGGTLNRIGKNSDETAKGLLQLGETVQSSTNGERLKMSMTQQELANVALTSQMNKKETLQGADAQAKAAEQTYRLGDAIRLQAGATGKSTTEITRELQARLSQTETATRMQRATEEQREAIMQSIVKTTGFGQSITNLGDIVQAGGRMTKEAMYTQMAMGKEGATLYKQGMRQMQNAKTPEDQARAQALLDQSKVAVANFQQSKQYQSMLYNAKPELQEAAKRVSSEFSGERGMVLAGQRDGTGTRVQREQQRLDETQKNVTGRTPTGEVNPNAVPAQAINKFDQAAFKQANDSLTVLGSTITKSLANAPNVLNNVDAGLKKVFADKGSLEQAAQTLVKATGGTANPNAPPSSTNTSTARPAATANNPLPPKTRDVTTIGATGKLFEPQDFYGKVAAGEGVFSPEQIKNLMLGAKANESDKTSGLLAGLKTSMSGMFAAPKTDVTPKSTKKDDGVSQAITNGVVTPKDLQAFLASAVPQNNAQKSFDAKTTSTVGAMPNIPDISGAIKGMQGTFASMPDMMGRNQQINQPTIKETRQSEPVVAPAPTPAPEPATRAQPKQENEPMGGAGGTIGLKDIHTALLDLNKSIMKMSAHTENISESSKKTAKMSSKATGNRAYA